MRQLRATGERNRLRIAEPPQQSRRVFLRLKSPPEGGIWGGVRLVNDANGGDNTIGSKPTERKINKLHKRMNNKYSLPKDGGLISESAPRDIIHRYEKIHTKVYENEYEGVQYVADNIVKAIRMYNEIHCSNEVYEESQPFVLGLTKGRSASGTSPFTASTSSTRSGRPNSRAATTASTRSSSTTSTSCPRTCTSPTVRFPRTAFRNTALRTTTRYGAST